MVSFVIRIRLLLLVLGVAGEGGLAAIWEGVFRREDDRVFCAGGVSIVPVFYFVSVGRPWWCGSVRKRDKSFRVFFVFAQVKFWAMVLAVKEDCGM